MLQSLKPFFPSEQARPGQLASLFVVCFSFLIQLKDSDFQSIGRARCREDGICPVWGSAPLNISLQGRVKRPVCTLTHMSFDHVVLRLNVS